MSAMPDAVRRVEPRALDWRSLDWSHGRFDSARREPTPRVEGEIRLPQHLLLLTVRGGAEALDVRSDCGHRYRGRDSAGAVSFVPAGCGRRLSMIRVQAHWASLTLDPQLFDAATSSALRAFTNRRDPLLQGLLSTLEQTFRRDHALDRDYLDALGVAAARHLAATARAASGDDLETRSSALPGWRVRRIADYVDAHLDRPIRIGDLAALVGLSEGHLHRAFRASLGLTPLAYVQQRRIERAMDELARHPETPLLDLALRVGFTSPGHFARTFRRIAGVSPSRYRRD